jgi:lipopolysaccharide transport system permease protein
MAEPAPATVDVGAGSRRNRRGVARQRVLAPFDAFGRHWNLVLELTRRDILGRYRGASFGLLWSLFGPLMILAIYSVAFGQIFKSRWQQDAGEDAAFGIVLFLGIIVHGFFAECFARSPRLMLDNANYVKRVIFPLQVLPWSVALSALFHTAMNMLVFVVLAALVYDRASPLLFLVPVVLAPLVLLTVAVSWVVASLGVYVRDINQATPVVVTALFFLSSAIVPVHTLSPRYQAIFHLNPLTFFIDQVRDVALWGRAPDWSSLGAWMLVAVAALYLAHAWFRTTSKGFADVL